MFTKWTAHLPKEKQTEFKMAVSGAQPVLRRLHKLIEEENKSSHNKMLEPEAYHTASWAYAQADSLGEQRAYQRVLKLLDNIIHEE